MKKITAATLVAILVLGGIYSCKKVIKKIFNGIDIEVPEIVLTVPAINLPIPVPDAEFPFPAFTQHINMDSLIKEKTNNEFTKDDISSIKIKQIAFSLSNGDSMNNFSNFKYAKIALSSNSNTTPVSIADLNFPDTFAVKNTYVAPADSPELISYLKGSELNYNVSGKLRRYTTKALKLAVVVTIRVN